MRCKLCNKDFTLLANNCNGGFIYHDLGIKFNSPTINLFFVNDHFFTFLEHLSEYIQQELKLATTPIVKPEIDYPVFQLGGSNNLPVIELHFMHYHSEEAARDSWTKRVKRIDLSNLFVIFTFFDNTDEQWLKRFDNIPIKNKIAFVNHPYPSIKSAFYIKGYEETGLGRLNDYINLRGQRKYDSFNFINWLNQN